MAKTNVYAKRNLRAVTLVHPKAQGVKFLYCFLTSVDATEVSDLGQTDLSSGTISGSVPAIIGARFPQPSKLKHAVSGISSYCSSDSFANALKKGWKTVSKPKFLSPRTQSTTAPSSVTAAKGSVIATVKAKTDGGDIWWGWRMPKYQLAKISGSDLTALGVDFPNTEEEWRSITLGVNAPYPPRAIKNLATTTSSGSGSNTVTDTTVETVSTFYDYTKTDLPAGWIPRTGGKYKTTIFE